MTDLPENLRRQPMALLGLGVENRALGRFLQKRRLPFAVCDAGEPPGLAALQTEWGASVTEWCLGPHYLDHLERFALLWRTPGLPCRAPALVQARDRGVAVGSQTQLFMRLCPAPVVGITGTKGKGTTTSLLGAMLTAGPYRKVWIGGNIGAPPIDFLDQIHPQDLVVLELSSFQLQDLDRSPQTALVLSVTQDHLDYHADRREYVEAKEAISRHQGPNDLLIYNFDCPSARAFPGPARRLAYSGRQAVEAGTWLEAGRLWWRPPGGASRSICPTDTIPLPGRHNRENAAAAAAAAAALGAAPEQIAAALQNFAALPHRLEWVAKIDGISYYNDSLATTPDAAIAALQAFTTPLLLIAGGSSKGADFTQLGHQLSASCLRALLLLAPEGQRIAQAALAAGKIPADRIVHCADLTAAMAEVDNRAHRGDTVLLSPACASFGLFANYAERGEAFRQLVHSRGSRP